MFGVVLGLFTAASCEKPDEVIAVESLPREVTTLVQTHFPGVEIVNVIKDYSGRKSYDFEISLNDGTRLDVLKNGQWKEVSNYKKGVPSSIIPVSILTYVTKNHAEALVISIDHERGYDVELNIGVEIVFDASGNFSRYDY